MTREEIEKFSGIEPYSFETDREEMWYKIGCIDGLDAADEKPDTTKLWHDVYEEPEIGSNIVVVDKNGQWWDIQPYDGEYDGYGGLTGWSCCVVHYNNIQHWAYISDLLPKIKTIMTSQFKGKFELKISNTTIKRAKQQFKPKIVDEAKYLLENESMAVIYGEFIDDSDNEELKCCLLYIINRTTTNNNSNKNI